MRSLPILGATAKGKGEKGKERLVKMVMECGTAQHIVAERRLLTTKLAVW